MSGGGLARLDPHHAAGLRRRLFVLATIARRGRLAREQSLAAPTIANFETAGHRLSGLAGILDYRSRKRQA
jgi:hypothetical protein